MKSFGLGSIVLATVLPLLAAVGCGGGGGGDDGVCAGVSCSGHGTCYDVSGVPECTCDSGFVPSTDNLSCLDAASCDGETCCDHGNCELVGGTATCNCDGGWVTDLADPMCCVGCTQSGVECAEDFQCCWEGTVGCIIEPGETTGYCSMQCQEHIHCVNFSTDGATMCCQVEGTTGHCYKSEVPCV